MSVAQDTSRAYFGVSVSIQIAIFVAVPVKTQSVVCSICILFFKINWKVPGAEEDMKNGMMAGLFFVVIANLSFAGNYILTVDGESHELSLDNKIEIEVGNKTVSAVLRQKDHLLYKTESFSFEHQKEYSPSHTDLGDGVLQTAMMTPLGTVIMIQEYSTIDPSGMMDLMINEITKEEREYGYKIDSKPITTTLSNGKVLNGKVVTSKYLESDIERYFYTYGVKDSGLFIITNIDYEIASGDQDVIDRFMESLTITLE